MKGDIAYCANPKCGKQFIKSRITQKCCGNPTCRTLYNRHKNGQSLYPDFLNYDSSKVRTPKRETGYTKQINPYSNLFGKAAGSAAGAAIGHMAKGLGNGSLGGAIAGNIVSSALIPYLKKIIGSGMKFSFNSINSELDVWQARLVYYEKRKQDALNGITPMKTLGMAGTGAALGATFAGKDKKLQRGFLFGLLGAALGAYMDANQTQTFEINRQFILEESEKGIAECNAQLAILRGEKSAYVELVNESILIENEEGVYVVSDEILNSTITGEDYTNLDIKHIKFKDAYHYLLGMPGPNFYKIITGMPGNGKTTYAVLFADYFGKNHGKTLYCPAEQAGNNKDFQNLLKRTKVSGSFDIQKKANILTSNDIISLVQLHKYKLIIFDSVNKMRLSPDDINSIREACPELAIFSVMQSTKGGNFKGSQEYHHDCDIYLSVDNFVVYQTKARSAGASQMAINKLIPVS